VKINVKFCQTSLQPKKHYYKTQHTREERDFREREREREDETLLELRFGREREESFLELRFERERERRVFWS
jgi:hypothetical protein